MVVYCKMEGLIEGSPPFKKDYNFFFNVLKYFKGEWGNTARVGILMWVELEMGNCG